MKSSLDCISHCCSLGCHHWRYYPAHEHEVWALPWPELQWSQHNEWCKDGHCPSHCQEGITGYLHSLPQACLKPGSWWYSQAYKSALEVVAEISKLIKKSPKWDSLFQKLKSELAPDLPGFCAPYPTRWTVHAASLLSVLDIYEVLLDVSRVHMCSLMVIWEQGLLEYSDAHIWLSCWHFPWEASSAPHW